MGYKLKRILIRPNQKRLPNEYQEVEYIESDGTPRIDTGYKPNNNTEVEMKFMMTYNTGAYLYGCRNGESGANRRALAFQQDNNKLIAQVYSNTGQYSIDVYSLQNYSLNTIYTSKVNDTSFYLDGVLQGNFASHSSYSINYNMYIFTGNIAGTVGNQIGFKLYSFKINESGTPIREFVPCYRKLDNVIGLYDLVNDQFYTNAGSGAFTKGSDIPDVVERQIRPPSFPSEYQEVEYIQSSGTQYINTGVYGSQADNVEIDFSFPTLPNAVVVPFGSREANNVAASVLRLNSSNQIEPYFGAALNTGVTITANGRYKTRTEYKSGSQSVYVDGVLKKTGSLTYTYLDSYTNYLFAFHGTGGVEAPCSCKIYNCKVWLNNNPVRNFVPCYRIADNVIGMYDMVGRQFYTNAGSGTFTKGPDV